MIEEAQKVKSRLPESKDPLYNAQRKELLRTAANFHFQMRVHTNLCVNLLNKFNEPELTVRIEGVDFSVCNPVGPLSVKLSLMLRKFSIDTYYRNREIALGSINRKKKGIFDGERGTVRGSKRRVHPEKETIFDSGNIIERRKM